MSLYENDQEKDGKVFEVFRKVMGTLMNEIGMQNGYVD